MNPLDELLAQKAALDQKILETRRNLKADAVAKVRALMAEHGLTAADLSARATTTQKKSGTASKVAVKYRNASTGESWTGRGLQPRWLKAALAQGRKLGDFAV